ncbi:DNA gyrase subunit B [Streptomyces sp. NPDC059491]|uniref:DNA gyrase subunit B n=1 Tax=Streptomyces sp. NPDC059491 TaxID=3346850 RepID=UPI00368503C7
MVSGIVEHAVDGSRFGRCPAIEVTLTADGGVRVSDDGPGIPFASPADDGGPCLGELLIRGDGERDAVNRNQVWSPVGGIDFPVANGLSSRLTAEVCRGGERWVQEYERGIALTAPTLAGTTPRTGTSITFHPDADLFETVDCSYPVLGERFRELAFLYPGLDISLTDERPAEGPAVQRYRFPGGVRDYAASLSCARSMLPHSDITSFSVEDPDGAGVLDVALAWRYGDDMHGRILTYANGRFTREGGAHADGFRQGMAAAVTAYGRAHGLLTATDPELRPDRLDPDLVAVVSVKLDRPDIDGCTRERLAGGEVHRWVEEAVRYGFLACLEARPEWGDGYVERLLARLRPTESDTP